MSDTQTSGASTVDSGSSNNDKPPEIVYTKLPAGKLLKKRDLPPHKDSIPWDRVELPVDVMLLTVKECEFLSCVSYLNPGFYKSYHENLGYVYFGKIGEEGNTMKIAIQSCEMGSDDAIVVVKNAAVALSPKAVFCVGFCGGLKENLKLGDVVISSKLRTYSSVKVTESAVEDRNVAVPLNTHLSKLLLHADAGWKPPLKDEVEVDVITNGVLLSGPEVVDNKDRRAELIRRFSDATAIEMEGQGLFKAARDLKMEWVVIKGVSDFADGKKSATNAWRPFASVMAASVTAHILSDPNAFKNLDHYGATSSAEESKRKAAEVGDQAAKRRKETGDN